MASLRVYSFLTSSRQRALGQFFRIKHCVHDVPRAFVVQVCTPRTLRIFSEEKALHRSGCLQRGEACMASFKSAALSKIVETHCIAALKRSVSEPARNSKSVRIGHVGSPVFCRELLEQ